MNYRVAEQVRFLGQCFLYNRRRTTEARTTDLLPPNYYTGGFDVSEIININNSTNESSEIIRPETELVEIMEGVLLNTRADISKRTGLAMPIAQLATLGAGVSSLIPELHTVTQTMTVDMQGLYQLANAAVGDTLKKTQNGNFWAALKTAEGTSKLAQLKAAGPLTAKSTSELPIDPAIVMMAVALFSIERQLGNIAEMEKQMLAFLEAEKEAEIEADVETLCNIINKYKHNWENEHFIASNHKMVLDIQRTARKNMLSYQKKVNEMLRSKPLIVAQAKVHSTLKDMEKKFKYYRLSLYTFAMASLLEIMLGGNFEEAYISGIKEEIEKFAMDYRKYFMQGSVYLEELSSSSVETNLLKGVGTASKSVGKLIGSIPVIKEGLVDEFLQEKGVSMKENARGIETDVLTSFAEISNPGTNVFTERMEDLIQIYNHTSEIYFDNKQIYLIAG